MARQTSTTQKLLWFVGLWAAGVTTLGIIALLIKLAL